MSCQFWARNFFYKIFRCFLVVFLGGKSVAVLDGNELFEQLSKRTM